MNSIVQHIPGFVDMREPAPRADFDTLEELLEVPFVKQWEDDGFCRWSHDGNYLMVERDAGKWWWVVGYLAEPVQGLPIWQKPPAEPQRKKSKYGY